MSDIETRVVLVDDDKHICKSTAQTLQMEGIDVDVFDDADSAVTEFDAVRTGVIVCDIKMPGMSGLELMQRAREIDPEIPVILITGYGDIATAVRAMRDGAYDFIEKPFAPDNLVEVVRKAMERRRLVLENRNLKLELALQSVPGQSIIGKSAAIQQLRRQIVRLAATQADILLCGETGTGKELVARNLHEISERRNAPYVAINCGAIPESLIESELFGHTANAFTGASTARVGRFEHANGGTVFLDEIESMPLNLQVKVLRVLQEREVEPLGSNNQIPVDVRIIAATKVDLQEAIEAGAFREDLYYRINVVMVNLPTLRDRIDDIPLLFHHFALLASARHDCDLPMLEAEQLQYILTNPWPGNVRELKNAAERFVLLGQGPEFENSLFGPPLEQIPETLHKRVESFEKNLIEQALEECGGSINATVESLGASRKTLYSKMRKYQIDKNRFK